MKGLIRGAAGLAVVLAMSACSKDETIDLMGPPTGVQATPVSAFTLKGDSVAILLRLVNDRNQSVPTEFTIGSVGPALQVVYDDKYRPDYSNGDTLIAPAIKPQQRYFARGFNIGKSTFTATAGGFTTTVTVVVSPKSLEAALSKTTGLVAGDTVTITAPAGLKFTPASTVTLATGAIAIASRAADSSNIKIILGPGAGGVATVTNVFRDYAPTLALMSLATTNAITATPAVTVAPTTVSNAAPGIGQAITVTLAGGLRFTSTSQIVIGGRKAGINAVSADSSTATVVPLFGSTGTLNYTGLVLSFLPSVSLSVAGDKAVTVSNVYAGPSDANTAAIATAPTLTLTGSRSIVVSDNGNVATACNIAATLGADATCRYYKVTAVAGAMSADLFWDAPANRDMGLYIFNAAGTACVGYMADDDAREAGSAGETGSTHTCAGAVSTLTAGQYLIAVVNFHGSEGPTTWYNFRISQP